MTVSLTGSDVIIINANVLSDLADQDIADLTFPNDIAQAKTGKNGNSIYALNESGRQADFKIRLIRGSGDDKFMNALLALQLANFAAFPLMQGQFTKNVGDGTGNVTQDTYVLSGGIFVKVPAAKSNTEGNTDQSVVMYEMKFTNAPRTIGS
jgi:hypothetical protein